MKIISKFKDYYDYLQGVYGIDEKITFDRRDKLASMYKPYHIEFPDSTKLHSDTFAICGKIYIVHIHNGCFYFGHDIKKILIGKSYNCAQYEDYDFNKTHYPTKWINNHLSDTDINDKENCPVLLVKLNGYSNEIEVISKLVRLSDFGFQQLISPHDMYINISNFLSREIPIVDKRTDIQKIVGKGFDKKTSFRNVK